MPRQQLKEALGALHEELESAEELGPEDRAALQDAMREIHETLDRTESREPAETGGPLSRRITGLIEDLETSHPRFAEILHNVAESLANLGI